MKSLPGHILIWAPDQHSFVCALPLSHAGCIGNWCLVPAKELVSPADLFGGQYPEVPAWSVISKCGWYRGDLAYIVSYNSKSDQVDVLVAS